MNNQPHAMQDALLALRRKLAALEPSGPYPAGRFDLGSPSVDAHLRGGLGRGALHEILAAEPSDTPAAAGFVTALALRASPAGRSLVWIRQAHGEAESGSLYPPGLAALGIEPDILIVVRPRDAVETLRAGIESVRCPALGAVIIEPRSGPKALDLSATRRLSLAATQTGVTAFLLRTGAASHPSAASTRWRVASAPSRRLAANAPGHPAFDIELLRHRAGIPEACWRLEWDHDHRFFRETAPLSGAVAPVPAGRPSAPPSRGLAKAG